MRARHYRLTVRCVCGDGVVVRGLAVELAQNVGRMRCICGRVLQPNPRAQAEAFRAPYAFVEETR